MKQPPRERPFKDERDRMIDEKARGHALEYMTAATQILTVMCLFKGNPAWMGCLSLLFFGIAFALFYKHRAYGEKPYRSVGIASLLVGFGLILWFGLRG